MNLAPRQTKSGDVRGDHKVVASLVPHNARVLDIGSADGELLDLLVRERQVDGRGIELSQEGVNRCVARGLSVIRAMLTRTCPTIRTGRSTSSS